MKTCEKWKKEAKNKSYHPGCHSHNPVELQWLEHLRDHENIFETGVVRANECYS